MKEKLQRLIDAARAKEKEALVPSVNDAPPPVAGHWTAKDQLAHMMSWRQVMTGELEAVRAGAPVPDVSTDDDVENVKFYSQTHDLPAHSIIDSAARSWDSLASAVEACTEDELQKPRPRHLHLPLWFGVVANTFDHVGEHLAYWYSEAGDEAEAEKAAIWAHDLAFAVFAEDRRRGPAEYNLGCFYAKRGRAAEALTHLRRAFELRPDLRDWAKEDHDLDAIRAEVAELRAG